MQVNGENGPYPTSRSDQSVKRLRISSVSVTAVIGSLGGIYPRFCQNFGRFFRTRLGLVDKEAWMGRSWQTARLPNSRLLSSPP